MPFVQYVGSYSDEVSAPAPSANAVAEIIDETATRETGPRIAAMRGERVFSVQAADTQYGVPATKDDRLAADGAQQIDRHRLAYSANVVPDVVQPNRARFLAPTQVAGTTKLSKALAASRSGMLAKLGASGQDGADDAASQSVASAIRADIAGNMPHPSMRPEVQLASLTTAEVENEPLAQRFADQIPVPTARPQTPQRAVRELASIASEAEEEAPLAASLNPKESIGLPNDAPLPKARPTHRASVPAKASSQKAPAVLAYAPDNGATDDGGGGGLFGGLGKLFSGGGGHSNLPGPGSGVAVYDIKSATVYLPNGQKLEAHSGLGHMQDNPRYVDQKSKGPTPPNVYNLVMRERPFHGVEAVRLLPADGKKKYGRDGLLAHTYMYRYGDSSQSNGCVVFKDYKRFLRAFKQGKITRMVVVPDMSKLPTYMAAL